MAFDKPTRNALARMVADCRRLLTNDVREQLQATYGIQPDGTALEAIKLAHLDDRGLEIATALREWLEHLCASEAGTEEQRRTNAFFRMTHETAFTYLNRLAALRMCEERGLIIECVRRGTGSDGFALYERLASQLHSRELAVRNQFFTPRYVVEFLTDNTLGRIWYEMQQGATVLKDECRSLVRRPHEIFLGPDEQSPATESVNTDLPQEELLQRPVCILHRARKDPRDLKILDPACGSGHFLLYAFDLLEHIYIEAWQDESAPASEITGESLRDEDDYKTEQALRSAIPGLILKHNLYGIDIDPRACQIAALSLWLRAQRSYQKLGLKAAERSSITKINIVCAEPGDVSGDYPLRISWSGILVDDDGHPDDIIGCLRRALEVIWPSTASEIEQEACDLLGVKSLRDYITRPNGFFADHLKRYSKSRRKAPLYWPLSTASGSYSVWVYYHRLTDQTLYTIVNRCLEPKIEDVQRRMARIEEDLPNASGAEATRLRDVLHAHRKLLDELQDMKQELLRVAALPYKPDLNDGVIINAAPLSKLFQHRAWAKDCWEKLEKGDYDWSHMAFNIWPDRVREKCKQDRSQAIAHGLEDICEVPLSGEKKTRKRPKSKT